MNSDSHSVHFIQTQVCGACMSQEQRDNDDITMVSFFSRLLSVLFFCHNGETMMGASDRNHGFASKALEHLSNNKFFELNN